MRLLAPVKNTLSNISSGETLKRIRNRTLNTIKKDAKSRALKAVPQLFAGKSIASIAKKNIPGMALNLAKKMPGILKDEIFTKQSSGTKRKKKKPAKKKKTVGKVTKRRKQKGGGMHSLTHNTGAFMKRARGRNIFGDDCY